jgi:hypothetical protein
MSTIFHQLNIGWNAEPNAPAPRIYVEGTTAVLNFLLNYMVFRQFGPEDLGVLRFERCSRYRLGSTNDEGWHRGRCRFSAVAPKWGEFYEIAGDSMSEKAPDDWVQLAVQESSRHFLFYLRDNTFECDAEDWSFSVTACDRTLEAHETDLVDRWIEQGGKTVGDGKGSRGTE